MLNLKDLFQLYYVVNMSALHRLRENSVIGGTQNRKQY